jgi:hypothetical protein
VSSSEGAAANLGLTGNGVFPELGFDPASLDFGDVVVGATSPPQTATLHNTGNAAATELGFDALVAGFDIDTGSCGPALAAGASCEVSIAFTPTTTGPVNAAWQVSSAEGVTAGLALAGNGTIPDLGFDPASLDFGDVAIGTTSQPQTATLHNSGSTAATGLTFPSPGQGFDVDASACGSTLAAGASCEVHVTFTPTSTGDINATWQVASTEGVAAELQLDASGIIGDVIFSNGFE